MPPTSPFLLAYKPLKQIVPTDNMRAKVRQHKKASLVVKGLVCLSDYAYLTAASETIGLTATGATVLARALQHNQSLEELK